MKNIYCLAFCAFSFFAAVSQNTGIGTPTPVQTLDVNGAVKVGNSTNNQPGSIRYNSGSFEGGNGTNWQTLAVPSKAIIMVRGSDTPAVKPAGFTVTRQMDIWDTIYSSISTNYTGSWTSGFPLSSTAVTPSGTSGNESVMYNNNLIIYGNDAFLYEYDIAGQKWVKLPNVSPLGARISCGVTLVGNDVYITGGYRYVAGIVTYNTCAKYNMITNVWTTIANMPVANCIHATAAIGTDIYLLDGSTDLVNFQKKMYKYNTLTNTWSGDLSVAATPGFLYGGMLVSWNNKLVWHNGALKVYAYDPVANTNTDLTPAGPPVATQFQGYTLSLASNKLEILGYIEDTTNVIATPGVYAGAFYEVDLTNGNTVQLSTCNLPGPTSAACFQYSASTDKFYEIGFEPTYNVFNRTGSTACNINLRKKDYWFYIKKN